MEVVKPERFFHERFGLSDRALERVLGTALERRADWADLYFEFRVNQTASLEEGVVKKATRNVSQGVGVRVVAGACSGYAHSDEVSLERLELAARAARAITDERGAATALPATRAAAATHDLYPVARPPIDTPTADQVALLQRLDAAARAVDPCITNVFAGIGIEHRVVLVVTSAGAVVGDVRPLVHVSVTCIAERGGRREQGSYGGGGRFAFDTLLDGRAERFAREAARQALTNLAAADAPAGTMTVVLGPGWPGVLLHEAIGQVSRATSTASACPRSPTASARASPRRCARWSTTAPSPNAAARSTSTTRARPRSARCCSSAASCAAISRI